MIRALRVPRALAVLFWVALFLFVAACGGSTTTTIGGASEDEGEPVPGGTAKILQSAEPRSLDPAALSNNYAFQPALGNALYGTLMINDIDTLETEYKMATDFSTTDGGLTFNLALQPDLKFSDGTPLDAEAVKFNWDRLKDPTLGSTSIRQASQVATTEVIDPTTVKVTLVSPNPHFAEPVVAGALNWIASPAALQQGREAFDRNPIGAGPFTLTSWARQDAIELDKNPDYWDAPKPYLDHLTIRSVADSNQRLNAITTGGADLASETGMANINKATSAGFRSEIVPTGGGQYIGMNQRRAPFDDVRARRAVALAADPEALNTIVYNGENEVPQTLFAESSPFFTDVELQRSNKEEAQALFDELADAGKPVEFTFVSYPTTESKVIAEGLQTQMGGYDNVNMKVEVLDPAAVTARTGQRDFDMVISSAVIQDPDYSLWSAFHSKSQGNFIGTNDPQLDEALDAGRISESPEDRKTAYNTVQERLVEVVPGIWYTRAVPSVIYGENVKGVELFTLGSPLPEELWIN